MKALLLLAMVACTVDRKSDSIKCGTLADCDDNHACQDGYCVEQSKSDCPDHCASCSISVTPRICTVTSTDRDSFECPSGFQCILSCTSAQPCGRIECHGDSQCVISCAGADSCGSTECADACACDVTCTGGGCESIACPHDGGAYCTPDQTDNDGACTSAPGGRCNSC